MGYLGVTKGEGCVPIRILQQSTNCCQLNMNAKKFCKIGLKLVLICEELIFNTTYFLQRGRRVPVIIPQQVKVVMEYLVCPRVREAAGVPSVNPYVFASGGKYFSFTYGY